MRWNGLPTDSKGTANYCNMRAAQAFTETRFFRYTKGRMPILKNIAAIAKGMSITFMEMFQPTTVENYPDGPGPLRGAKFQWRYRGMHVLQRDENGFDKYAACAMCTANHTA